METICPFFAQDIMETNWEKLKNNNIDIYAQNVTNEISKLAKKHIPNKTVKIRQSDPSWLTSEIKKMIRKRKRLYKQYKRSKCSADFENYKHLRNKTIAEIRQSKQLEIDKLAAKLRNNDIKPKDWWKTLKHFLKPDQSTSLPLLHHDNAVFTEEPDKASLLNDCFVGQTNLDESQASLPSDTPIPDNNLNSISTSPSEVASTLKSLQLGKATGPDAINNGILKELATPLSFPLSDLFKFSLALAKYLKYGRKQMFHRYLKNRILHSFLTTGPFRFLVKWVKCWKNCSQAFV